MAGTQTNPASAVINAIVGVPFSIPVSFGPGGNAKLISFDKDLLNVQSVSADNTAPNHTTLATEFMPVKDGRAQAVYLTNPIGSEPLETQKIYAILISVPNKG